MDIKFQAGSGLRSDGPTRGAPARTLRTTTVIYSGKSALARRFEPLEYQRQQRIDARRGTRLVPFLGVRGMVEAAGGVEDGSGRNLGVGDLERSLLHTVGKNPGYLIDQAILVAIDGLAGLSGQRQVGRKHFGVCA